MTQEFVTLPREVVDNVRGALAYVGVGNAFENPNLAQSTCKQAIWKLDHALRAALEQPQVEREQASTNTWSTADGIRCLHCHLPLSSHREQRYCQRVENGSQAEQPAMTRIAQRKLDSLLAEGYTISGYSVYHELKHQHGFVTGAGLVGWWRPEGMEHPQPNREPLTDKQIITIMQDGNNVNYNCWVDHIDFARASEAAHNIK